MSEQVDLAQLREIAQQATPGPWECWNPAAGESHISVGGKIAWRSVESATPFPEDQVIPHWADATHIAAFDPPTVLALLDRIKYLEGQACRNYQDWQIAYGRAEAAEQAVARVREIAKADLKCPCCSGYEEILRALAGDQA